MKKIVLTMCLGLLCSFGYAQDRGYTYFNLNYSSASISQPNTEKISNDFGAGFTVGHNYYLHIAPIASMLWFGIDATWFDINYNKYSYTRYRYYGDSSSEKIHQGEVGMQVGPSLTIVPVNKLKIKTYFKFAPSCAILYDSGSEDVSCGFAPMFNGGLSVNYGFIGAGIEARFGSPKLQQYTFVKGDLSKDNVSTKISGMRVYLSFIF